MFDTDAQKNEAKDHLEGLRNHPDWIWLVEEVIKPKIEELTQRILNPKEEWKDGEEKEAKSNREHWIMLSELPTELLKTLTEKPEQAEDYDPYVKKPKELNR